MERAAELFSFLSGYWLRPELIWLPQEGTDAYLYLFCQSTFFSADVKNKEKKLYIFSHFIYGCIMHKSLGVLFDLLMLIDYYDTPVGRMLLFVGNIS